MKELWKIETERADDVPLLLAHMQRMNLARLLDKHIPAHGNRKGLSVGEVTVVWLSHILSEASHQMNHVQEWSKQRKEILRCCGFETFEIRDMTDDRLADILHALSNDTSWLAFEQELMENLVRVYGVQKECVRIDTTSVKSYAEVNEQGLLQYGHSKDHRPDLAQLKVVLASLDPLGMPLATEVISGEQADDPVSIPIIARVREGLKEKQLLYIGDCKMAALQTRATIQFQHDYSLCPLSATQVSSEDVRQNVDALRKKGTMLQSVEHLNEKNERIVIAQGYEIAQELTTEVNGEIQRWTERRFLVQSTSGLKAATQHLQERIDKAEQAIQEISVRKQGKVRVKTREEVEQAVQDVVKKFQVQELLEVTIHEEYQEQKIRAYKGKAASLHREVVFLLKTERREKAIEYAISHLKWRIYATNQEKEQSTLEQAIEAYRDEYRVERNFERLKGHPLSLAPLYVQRDDHRIGLVRLLTIALRVLTLLEGMVRKRLSEEQKERAGLYAGNPKRRTNQPTTERLLEAFENITCTVISTADGVQRHITPLSSLQQDILAFLGLLPVIYSQLADDS